MSVQLIKKDDNYETHLISTIIPAYNAADSICNALDSIKKQDVKEIQIIVIDDGSTDNTKFEVLSYMDRNPEMDILYIQQENSGPGVARNAGLDHADGKYICFLDSDDFIPKHAYKQYLHVANKWDCDIVIGSYMRSVDGGKWHVPAYINDLCTENDGKNLTGNYVAAINSPSLWNRMFRREFLNENNIRFLNENHGEDVVFNLDAIRHAKGIYTTNSVCCYYSKREKGGDSISTAWTFRSTSSLIRTVRSKMLFFEEVGDVYAEMTFLRIEITYLLQGIRKVEDKDERDQLHEMLMKALSVYLGNKKYEPLISMILGVDLELAVQLPFDAYMMYKQRFWAEKHSNSSGNKNNGYFSPNGDNKEIVLSQFKNGQIGFRYIVKYFLAWFKFKISRK